MDRFLSRWKIAKVAKIIDKDDVVLDLGCGVEYPFLEVVQGKIKFGYGIDKYAKNNKFEKFEIIKGNLEKPLEFPDRHFNVITALGSLKFVKNLDRLAYNCNRMLKDDGKIIITIPKNNSGWIFRSLSFLRLFDSENAKEPILYDDKRFLSIFRKHFKITVKDQLFGYSTMIIGTKMGKK